MKNKNIKKAIALILFIITIIASIQLNVLAAAPKNPKLLTEEVRTNSAGAEITELVDSKGKPVSTEQEASEDLVGSAATPSEWDSRDKGWVTPVKNQLSYNSCWAFAFCAAAESSIIAQGYGTKDDVDISEAHLIYFRNGNYVEGSDNPVQQDKYNGFTDSFSKGGNNSDAISTVSRWSGLADESKYPFSKYKSDMQYSPDAMFDRDYELISTRDIDAKDVGAVKEAIMNYGALTLPVYYSGQYTTYTNYGCYYYQNAQTGANHAVTVVGWDDNVSASLFKTKPEGNGAWLIKNSWGTSQNKNGYYWLSYYDTSIRYFTQIIAKPVGESSFDNNYQYDGVNPASMLSYGHKFVMSNVFEAHGHEAINGFSFRKAIADEYNCTVSIYGNLTSADNPTDGTLLETMSFDCTEKGFYTIELNDMYEVAPGEKFSVVICFENPDGSVQVSVEHLKDTDYTYSCEKGQSLFSADGVTWRDNTAINCGNFPIKAYTKNINDETDAVLSAKKNSGVYIDNKNIISGIKPGTNLREVLNAKDGYTFNYTVVGTGHSVTVYNAQSELVEIYRILIYGDVTGDGWYDNSDAELVKQYISHNNQTESLDTLKFEAADCNHDGTVNQTDYSLIASAEQYLNAIDKNNVDFKDPSYVDYSNIINQNPNTSIDTGHETEESVSEPENEAIKALSIITKYINSFITAINRILKTLGLSK